MGTNEIAHLHSCGHLQYCPQAVVGEMHFQVCAVTGRWSGGCTFGTGGRERWVTGFTFIVGILDSQTNIEINASIGQLIWVGSSVVCRPLGPATTCTEIVVDLGETVARQILTANRWYVCRMLTWW